MVGLRKGKCYRTVKRPYTRTSKYKKKSYISTIPPKKLVTFCMGNTKKNYKYTIRLISKSDVQIRQNAIESARQVVNRHLDVHLGQDYSLTVDIYPHHILRENKMIGGAHADRLQSGMAHSFGRVVGAAAQVMEGKSILTARADDINVVKEAFRKSIPRLPVKCKINIQENLIKE